MHTLPDVIKAGMHACFALGGFAFNPLLLVAQWLRLVQQFQLYMLAKVYNKLFKSKVSFCSKLYKK